MKPARLVPVLVTVLALATLPAAAREASPSPGTPTAEKWAGGLKMPVDIEWGRDGALYAIELAKGDIVRLKDRAVDGDPIGHVDVTFGGERGLMGMALDPKHKGRVWVYYTVAGGAMEDPPTWRGTNQLSYFEGGKETKVATFRAGFMHNSGRIAFAPDGNSFYLAVGDTGDRAATQNLEIPEGKLLRLDRDGNGVDGNFRDRIVSYGHRNMYGIAVAADGTVLVTENMNGQHDELNIDQVGGNFGWPFCEGPNKVDAKEPCDHEQIGPIASFEATVAPTGAAWMGGSFWWAAFNKGDIHRVSWDGSAWKDEVVYHHGDTPRILDVTPGPEGNTLYFSAWTVRDNPDDSEGQIWRLAFPDLASTDPNVHGLGSADPGSDPVVPVDPVEPPWKRYVPSAPLALAVVAAALLAARRR